MAHVFHVEFGINDTDLTRALENGNYASAERLILDCTNPSYLDEGCYQRTPLNICLCGVDQDGERVTARNLHLARLLIERGANLNHRVPVMYFGSEFVSPGKTCLELLTDYYVDLTRNADHPSQQLSESLESWSCAVDVVVGIGKQYLVSVTDILHDILDLVFVVLNSGGDSNVVDENHMTPLHHVCTHSQDIRLLTMLCSHGADANAKDCHGNTPLLSLCDLATARLYDNAQDLSSLCSEESVLSLPVSGAINPQLLDYLLTIKHVDVNQQNALGRTALFSCMVRGDVESTAKLLRAGADPTLQGCVWESRKKKRHASPLLAVFAGYPVRSKMLQEDPHHSLSTASQPFTHLVDAGYFSSTEIADELVDLIDTYCPELSPLRQHRDCLVRRLFGGTTCTLRQLAARTVFRQCLVDSTAALQRILPVTTFQHRFQPLDLRQREVYEEYMGLVVNHTVLKALVALLALPADTLLCLQLELLHQQLGLRLSALSVDRPELDFNILSEDHTQAASSEDNSEASEEGGDSDLEYW